MKKVKIFARIAALVAAAAILAACGTLPQELQQPENRTEDIAFLEVQPQKVPLAEIPQAPAVPLATEAPQPAPAEPAPTQPTPAQPVPVMTLEQAKSIVLAHLNLTEEQLSRVEFDFDDGVYELDFHVGNVEYDVKLDAAGKILNIQREEENKPQPTPAAITLEQAKQIVFAKLNITESQIADKEFDFDDGIYELEFRIGSMEYDFEVDAATGAIVKSEQEMDD